MTPRHAPRHHSVRRGAASALAALVVATGCGSDSPTATEPPTSDAGIGAYTARLDDLEAAVSSWAEADTIEVAHRGAEAAANLIVGPDGPGYGDRDGDGEVSGAASEGLLPGSSGMPVGVALPLGARACVDRDVLGGSWQDPARRWAEMISAIDAWRRESNTMPTLQSHPMRVVGWASFALATESLGEAREYSSHARIHTGIARTALTC